MHPNKTPLGTQVIFPDTLMCIRLIFSALLILGLANPVHAQDRLPLAQELITQKTGYTDPQLKPLLAQLQSHPSWTGGRP